VLLVVVIALFVAYLVAWYVDFRRGDFSVLPENYKKVERNVEQLNTRYAELERKLADLQKSHEFAIQVSQDLDRRLGAVEGRRKAGK